MCAHTCRSLKFRSCIFPLSFSTLMYLRERLSVNLEFINLVRLAGQWASAIFAFPAVPKGWGYKHASCGPNAHLSAYTAGAYQLGHREEYAFETKRQLRKPEEVSRSPSIRGKGKHNQSIWDTAHAILRRQFRIVRVTLKRDSSQLHFKILENKITDK